MGFDIGPSIGITGEAEFKTALKNINSQFKELGSEMKLATSQFDKNDKSVSALTAKNKVLTKELDAQKGKISLLTGQYDKQKSTLGELENKLDSAKKAFGENSDEVRKAQREYDQQSVKVNGLKTDLNNATANLNKMDRELATNNDSIKKASNNFGELSDTMNTKMNKAFGKVADAAKVAGAAIATGFTAMVANGVSGAMEAEDAAAQLDAVLESTAGAAGMTKEALIKMGDAMELTTKFSSEQVQAGEAILLTFTGIGKKTFPDATKAAADMAQALGTDVSSQAMVLGKALNDPVAGISKLTKVGVVFTDEQKKQVTAMAEAGDVAGAQKIILAELNKEFGGSAEAAGGTLSGKLIILKNAFGAVSEKIVSALMPYLDKFVAWVSANMPQIEAKMTTAFKGVSNFIKNYVVPVLTFLFDHIGAIKNAILIFVGALATWKTAMLVSNAIQEIQNVKMVASAIATGGAAAAQTALGTATGGAKAATLLSIGAMVAHKVALGASAIATGVATAAQWAWNAAMTANPIVLIIIAIAALIAAIVLIATHWKQVTKAIIDAWDKVKKVFEPVAKWFSKIFTAAFNGIKKAFSGVTGFFKGIWDEITGIFKKIGTTIGNGIGGAFKAVVNSVISFAEKMINDFIRSINLAIRLINKIPGVEISQIKELNIPKMNVGTRYLPSDMLVYAHQGEMIVPKSENPYANSGGQITPTGAKIEQTINIYSPQSLSPSQTAKLNKRAMQELALSF